MRRLSKRHIVNKYITSNLLNNDFIILTSKNLLLNLNRFKKSLIKYILPCVYTNYKKDFIYTYLNFTNYINFTFLKTNLIYIYKGFVFKNNLNIFKILVKHLPLASQIKKLKKLCLLLLLYKND